MSIYAMSDTHLCIETNKPMDIFGSRWSNWDKKIISAGLSTVTEKDTVIIPGDISWGIDFDDAKEDLKLIEALPGKKLISHGNHDYWWSTASKMNKFMEENGIRTIGILYNNAHIVEDRIICGSRGWYTDEKTAQGAKIKADYDKIVNRECVRLEMSLKEAEKLNSTLPEPLPLAAFFHFPPVFAQYICQPLIDVLHKYNVTDCYYGHIHGQYDVPAVIEHEGITFRMISADYLNFTPYKVN